MMLAKIILCFVTFKCVMSQLNGEFWWLNSKLAQLKRVEPPRPKFDDISEFDTDETAKVVFKDNSVDTEEPRKYADTTTAKTKNSEADIYFRDDSKFTRQLHTSKSDNNEVKNNLFDNLRGHEDNIKENNEDLFNFVFPNDAEILKNKAKNVVLNSANGAEKNENKNIILNDKTLLDAEQESSLSENICTYMKEAECNHRNGFPYIADKSKSLKNCIKYERICCILPLHQQKLSKITFPDNHNRMKRSANEQNISLALKQRNTLMQKKYGSQTANTQAPNLSTMSEKIVTPDHEDIDPYWNIKGSNSKHPDKQGIFMPSNSQQEYDDYYTEELPKPGLVGLYSDHRQPAWSFINAHKGFSYNNDEVSEEELESPGYSTIDPRQDSIADAPSTKRRLLKLKTSSEDLFPESQTVSYHSNPDFQVLHGFKLPNLMPKIKFHPMRNLRKKSATEMNGHSGVVKTHYESYIDSDYDDYIGIKEELYTECGRTKDEYFASRNCDGELGEITKGTHPWLLLAVLTKNKQSILCYATLIHPRAAITAADCTYGIARGEITIVAGMWDLKGDNGEQFQQRLASVHSHQQYLPGKLAYNIALLYWRRPLRLDPMVQPACISDANVDDDCVFVGWGGYDQGIRQRPQWQRATILSPRNCDERISTNQEFDLPIDAFCATVNSKTTVTGLGGPLLCQTDGKYSVAGFAIWRDEIVVLMRAQEWTIRALVALGIN